VFVGQSQGVIPQFCALCFIIDENQDPIESDCPDGYYWDKWFEKCLPMESAYPTERHKADFRNTKMLGFTNYKFFNVPDYHPEWYDVDELDIPVDCYIDIDNEIWYFTFTLVEIIDYSEGDRVADVGRGYKFNIDYVDPTIAYFPTKSSQYSYGVNVTVNLGGLPPPSGVQSTHAVAELSGKSVGVLWNPDIMRFSSPFTVYATPPAMPQWYFLVETDPMPETFWNLILDNLVLSGMVAFGILFLLARRYDWEIDL